MTPERKHKLQRVAAYAGVGLIAFAIALVVAFPYERAKDRVVAMLAERGFDVEVGSVGPALGLGLRLDDIVVRAHPTPPARPIRFVVDRARVLVSVLGALIGRPGAMVKADAFSGHFEYGRQVVKSDVLLAIKADAINMGELPGVREAINLPLSGTLALASDLKLPMGRLGDGSGTIEWKCSACTLGDGKEKLKVAGNPLLAEGLSLPRIRLGDFEGHINIEKGVGKLAGVHAKSPDGEISIEGEILLHDPPLSSVLRLYITFKLSDALVKSSDKIQLLLQLAEAGGKRPDGSYGVTLTGRLEGLDPPQWAKVSPFPTGTAAVRPPPRAPGARPPGAPAAPPGIAPMHAAPPPMVPAPVPVVSAEPPPPTPNGNFVPLPAPPPPPPVQPAPMPVPQPDEPPVHATPPPATIPPGGSVMGESVRHAVGMARAVPADEAPPPRPDAAKKPNETDDEE